VTRWSFAILGIALGCGAKPGPPAWRSQRVGVERQTITPPTEQAVRYGEQPASAGSADPLARSVLDAAAQTNPALAEDERLNRACALLAQVTGDQQTPSYQAIEFALAHEGIIEPAPQLLAIQAADDDMGAAAAEIARVLPRAMEGGRFVRMGAGSAPSGRAGVRTLILALQESWIDAEPMAREIALGRSVTFRARIKPPYREPHVYLTRPSGVVDDLPFTKAGSELRVEIACREKGTLKVEVTGEDAAGSPSVLANFPVWCGERPPATLVIAAPATAAPIASTAEAEKRIFELANKERRKHGLEPLKWDDKAAEIARAHSLEMAADKYVAHHSPKTGSTGDRATRGGLGTPLLLENLARAYSPEEAHHGLMGSPGHRANLLSPKVTHLGVGVAPGESFPRQREIYVTQLFFRSSPKVDKDYARLQVLDAVKARRKAQNRTQVVPDPRLQEIAQGYADAAAAGRKGDGQAWAKRKIADLVGYQRVVTIMGIAGDPVDAIGDGVVDGGYRIGIGIAQGTSPRFGDNAVFVVIMMGGR
jgi:uncharacterized protein YkwD